MERTDRRSGSISGRLEEVPAVSPPCSYKDCLPQGHTPSQGDGHSATDWQGYKGLTPRGGNSEMWCSCKLPVGLGDCIAAQLLSLLPLASSPALPTLTSRTFYETSSMLITDPESLLGELRPPKSKLSI